MASASVVRKKITIGVEVDSKHDERKRFDNTFKKEGKKFVVERLREGK